MFEMCVVMCSVTCLHCECSDSASEAEVLVEMA